MKVTGMDLKTLQKLLVSSESNSNHGEHTKDITKRS